MTRNVFTALMAALLLMALCGLWLSVSADAPVSAQPTATLPPVDDGNPTPAPRPPLDPYPVVLPGSYMPVTLYSYPYPVEAK